MKKQLLGFILIVVIVTGVFSVVSNVMKVKHDTVKNAIAVMKVRHDTAKNSISNLR